MNIHYFFIINVYEYRCCIFNLHFLLFFFLLDLLWNGIETEEKLLRDDISAISCPIYGRRHPVCSTRAGSS